MGRYKMSGMVVVKIVLAVAYAVAAYLTVRSVKPAK